MKTFQKDFAILHLSDLHIISHNEDYSTALHKMIDNISMTTRYAEKIIIVVTGDLVEKGMFSSNRDTILKFFFDLKNKLSNKVVDILFSPGNHDKKRRILSVPLDSSMNMIDKTNNATLSWGDFNKDDWEYFEKQFQDYLAITHHIREKIFDLEPYYTGTYGIHRIIINDYNICFICFNSSWSCKDNYDMGRLRIGNFQLEDLMKEYQKLRGANNIDLTIALMHHPSDWLTPLEQKYLNQYLIDEYRLNTNIILQGHIHDKDIYNWYNQNHSITTLVTGMGWDQQKDLNDSGHRYSIYEINCESGIASANTYVSDRSGEFSEDTSVYNGKNIVFPLYVHKYLEVNKLVFPDSEIEYYYPKENILENLGELAIQTSSFVLSMNNVIEGTKKEWEEQRQINGFVYSSLETLAKNESKEIHTRDTQNIYDNIYSVKDTNIPIIFNKTKVMVLIEKIKNHLSVVSSENESHFEITEYCNYIKDFKETQERIFLKEKFLGFLGEFCIRLCKKIFDKKKLQIDDIVRIHFRIIDLKNTSYKKIFSIQVTKTEDSKPQYLYDLDLTEINYENSLIELSFEKNKSMLYSLNPSHNTHTLKKHWKDFLTIASNNTYNNYKCKVDDEYCILPYISFGITVNSSNSQDIIRNLVYIGFEKILDSLFVSFFEDIPYDVEKIFNINKECQ